jgi:hypothetical protein
VWPLLAMRSVSWYGTDALWTELSVEGKWTMRDNVLNGKGYRTKLVFWRRGFDWRKEPEPKLIITGKRLNGEAPSLTESHASAVFISGRNASGMMPPGMMTMIDIPTVGCWELTAHYGGHTLAFIVSVEP